ncbi:hypothetical protein [Paenibacillus sp. SYP-B4298]|uniref:hypothetical protein n=1 Tax=Paenibacillus sp. SYP-B4298 TaxID=2996034 RepID=UPI0022DE903C|nr:hypothetical protein [Paenibacillus sp. SYP-B4298]
MRHWTARKAAFAMVMALVLTACGSGQGDLSEAAENTGSSPAAGQERQSSAGHGGQQEDGGEHGQQTSDAHGSSGNSHHKQASASNHGSSHGGGNGASGTQTTRENKAVALSEVKGVVASTSLTALIAEAAGASQVSYIAPIELRHPPEYDYRPSDIDKVADSYIVYLGYEPFMTKLMEAAQVSPDWAATIEVDNTPDSYKQATRKLADIWGTQDKQTHFLKELDTLSDEIIQAAHGQDVSAKKVVAQVYMAPFLKWLGYNVVAEYGPDEVTPSQLANLAKLEPELIVDNAHMPQGAGFAQIAKDTKRVELRSYPEQGMTTVLDILRYNAQQLGLVH